MPTLSRILVWLLPLGPLPLLAAEPVFDRDVMAVLAKAGCNAGTCHGNQNGKGGFFLSLRGQDPDRDYAAIVRENGGRRIDRLDPDASLLLRKPTGLVAHQGGVRFRRDSREYEILRAWIAGGARNSAASPLVRLDVSPAERLLIDPDREVSLSVAAVFADGTTRDVRELSVYETTDLIASVPMPGLVTREAFGETTVIVRFLNQQVPVRLTFLPARPDFVGSNPPRTNFIDDLVFEKLRTLRINPSELADDSAFVRRVFLDLLGVPPTADEARSFVAETEADKRSRLVDRLLYRPEFAEHWALKWSDLLRNEEKVLDAKGVELFHGWIRNSIAAGKPVDQFVRELVASRGSTYGNPPANFYRANRDPATRGETAARLFLGIRLQCSRCHNHPFDRWTQDDYYGWSALFSRIAYEIKENQRTDKLDLNEFVGEQIVIAKPDGELTNPRTGQPAAPRTLDAAAPAVSPAVGVLGVDPAADRLEVAARWLTASSNEAFAKSQANWVWYHLLGRGLVEPLDDFRATNPPTNPRLLGALAREFAASGFDLRSLVRTIVQSRTYQLAVRPNETNRDDTTNYSRAIVRRLTAEQLLDAQCQVLGAAARFAGYAPGLRAGQIPGVRKVGSRKDDELQEGDRFLRTFGKPERLLACECERSNETGLAQAFVLIGGEGLHERLRRPGNRLEQLANSDLSAEAIVAELFWSALGRPPSEEELRVAAARLAGPNRLAALQDLAWVLLNAKEFVFRR